MTNKDNHVTGTPEPTAEDAHPAPWRIVAASTDNGWGTDCIYDANGIEVIRLCFGDIDQQAARIVTAVNFLAFSEQTRVGSQQIESVECATCVGDGSIRAASGDHWTCADCNDIGLVIVKDASTHECAAARREAPECRQDVADLRDALIEREDLISTQQDVIADLQTQLANHRRLVRATGSANVVLGKLVRHEAVATDSIQRAYIGLVSAINVDRSTGTGTCNSAVALSTSQPVICDDSAVDFSCDISDDHDRDLALSLREGVNAKEQIA